MTPKEAAIQLDGDTYRREGTEPLFEAMKHAGLVAVFGYSDDLCEFRGAIDDEESCYGGGVAYVNERGLVRNECDAGTECPYFLHERQRSRQIAIQWHNEGDPCWTYDTDIPHETFQIIDDEDEHEIYCVGIVFRLSDATVGPNP